MKRIILLIAVLCICTGVSAQTRLDIGLKLGGSKDLGYEGTQVGVVARGLFDSQRFALVAEGSYLFRDKKYTGEGKGINFEGQARYYLFNLEGVKVFGSVGVDLRHLNAGTFTKTGANAFTGGGVVIKHTTVEGGYEFKDNTENEATAIRAEFEQLVMVKNKTYISFRGRVSKVDFSNPFTNRFNLSGTHAALTVSLGRMF